jgi:nitroimidazol reductase NimA-like FMN-containing flavoprotein (pyridoxamine 5'-phosphate oxidase superfamily)
VVPGPKIEGMTLIDNGLEILSAAQCLDLLARVSVGRVAVTVAALPAIFPVNYALLDDEIVFLTGEGTKLRAALERTVVAFQVDHIDEDAASGWSVLAVGVAEDISDPGERKAAAALGLRPFAGGDRVHFVKIRPEFLSGRRIA